MGGVGVLYIVWLYYNSLSAPVNDRFLTGASVHAVILSILDENDSYGYGILGRVEELSGGEIEWAAGSMYPVLRRMKTNGWVEDYWDEPDGRRRRYYRITDSGRKQLERERRKWMSVHRMFEQLWGLGGAGS